MKSIKVLRVGQRYVRDDRTLTHLCLVSRALGAESIYLEDAEKDVTSTLEEVNMTWGGKFEATLGAPWRKVIREAKKEGRSVVHLTMYGLPIQDVIQELRKLESILLVVGGRRSPGGSTMKRTSTSLSRRSLIRKWQPWRLRYMKSRAGKSLRGRFQKADLESCLPPMARGLQRIENRI